MHEWAPALVMGKIILSISSLLSDPNFDDPLNLEAARIYKEDPEMYEEICNSYKLRYCANST